MQEDSEVNLLLQIQKQAQVNIEIDLLQVQYVIKPVRFSRSFALWSQLWNDLQSGKVSQLLV